MKAYLSRSQLGSSFRTHADFSSGTNQDQLRSAFCVMNSVGTCRKAIIDEDTGTTTNQRNGKKKIVPLSVPSMEEPF